MALGLELVGTALELELERELELLLLELLLLLLLAIWKVCVGGGVGLWGQSYLITNLNRVRFNWPERPAGAHDRPLITVVTIVLTISHPP